MNSSFSHFDESGRTRMVDVGSKDVTDRFARASARIVMAASTLNQIREQMVGPSTSVEKNSDHESTDSVAHDESASEPIDASRIESSNQNDVKKLPGKGNVLEVARLAAIMAAKRTDELIPLCHALPLSGVEIHFSFESSKELRIESEVRVSARTGAEMEALTAVTIGALTVYDMCKAIDRSMIVESIQLEEKSGGKSGHYQRTT